MAAKNFDAAIAAYTKAIECDGSNPIYFGNRYDSTPLLVNINVSDESAYVDQQHTRKKPTTRPLSKTLKKPSLWTLHITKATLALVMLISVSRTMRPLSRRTRRQSKLTLAMLI